MWGAIIGAAISGAIAIYGNYQNSQAAEAQKDAAKKAEKELKAAYAELESDIKAHYAMTDEEKAQGESDVASYQEKLRGTNQEQYVKDFYADNGIDQRYSYDKDVSDFMDERADYLKSLAGRAAQASAAGAGMGRSYDGAMAIGTAVANKNEELWKNAQDAYATDRSQSYNEWNQYLQQKQAELTNLLSGQANDLSAAKDLAQMYKDQRDAEYQDLMNARIAAMNGNYAASSATANTGNWTMDMGGTAQLLATGANTGSKVADYFSGGNSTATGTAAANS